MNRLMVSGILRVLEENVMKTTTGMTCSLVLILSLGIVPDLSRSLSASQPAGEQLREMIEADWVRQASELEFYLPQDLSFHPDGTVATKNTGITTALDAAGAVDGIIDGRYGFHTQNDNPAWWAVDLQEPVLIDRVVVFNREDGGDSTRVRANGLILLVSMDGNFWKECARHQGQPFGGLATNNPWTVSLNGVEARYVRLQTPGQNFLHLDEVQIFPVGQPENNVALKKPADQSSLSDWSAFSEKVWPSTGANVNFNQDIVEQTFALADRTIEMLHNQVEESQRELWTQKLSELRKNWKNSLSVNEPSLTQEQLQDVYLSVRRLRREMILAHPLLNFDRLLINKRPPPTFNHQTDQYIARHNHVGDGPIILDNWKSLAGTPRETVLLRGKLLPGTVIHPDLSFDAKKIIFSYCDQTTDPRPEHRRSFLWEIGLDGTGLRQITGTLRDPLQGAYSRETVLIEDFDPCYLPDGRIAFVSTRNQGGVRCHHGDRYCPTYTLYRCDLDGENIVPLAHGEANEWDPSVLHDGRILWTRWDYINRHDTIYQSLWTIRPDGTGTSHLYGNYTINPCSLYEGKSIPGSKKIVATAGAHHNYTSGSIVVIDPDLGQDGPDPVTRITPEIMFPETEYWPVIQWSIGGAQTPWALSEDLFLCSYSSRPILTFEKNAYSIMLVDRIGGRELIYADPEMSCDSPIPILAREVPPVLPSVLPSTFADDNKSNDANKSNGYNEENKDNIQDYAQGYCYVQNIYNCTEPLPQDSIKKLRVVRIYEQPTQRVADRSATLFELPKEILGTVDVAEDGSVAFVAPAGVPLLFQLLDENDMSVMSMRSFVYLQPNEQMGCIGCHESRSNVPSMTAKRPIPVDQYAELTPPTGPQEKTGLSFMRTVQPVLDRYCIECHGLEKTEDGLNLLGKIHTGQLEMGRIHGSHSYDALVMKPGLVSIAYRDLETPQSKPMDYFAHAGTLATLLLYGDEHHPALAARDRESFLRVILWLDLNAQFFGDYSWNKEEWKKVNPQGEKELRDFARQLFGETVASAPLEALVNPCNAEESRIVCAPLVEAAGGWGQWQNPNSWTTKNGDYQKMLALVKNVYFPSKADDKFGACQLTPCECESCWVQKANIEYRQKLLSGYSPIISPADGANKK